MPVKFLLVAVVAVAAVPILLPIAGLSINFALLITAGAVIGFLSGLLGVGGGFLMTPILAMIGVPLTVAAASDTNAIVATSASGVAAHFRLKNVDLRMGTVCLVGGVFGSALGVQVIKILRASGGADFLITIMYIVVLGGVGSFTLRDSIKKLRRGVMEPKHSSRPTHRVSMLERLPFQISFERSGVRHSLLVPFCLCGLVGIMTAVMGVGGGFIMVPMMVYILRMPAHVAVGTDLFQIMFTCIGVTLMQAATNHTVDVVLAILIAAGSTIGAQIGARVSKRLRGEQLLIVLGVLALAVGIRMAVGIVLPPANPLSPSGGHAEVQRDHRTAVAQVWASRGH
ncbi:MAG: sulfite exporter TauE/SafE family protein [Terriglobia bacterium]|nr:sulfite exporter TauE/SafE family protein [Terriglobia bacterium]